MKFYQNKLNIKVEIEDVGTIYISKEYLNKDKLEDFITDQIKTIILDKHFKVKYTEDIIDKLRSINRLDKVYEEINV